MNRAFDYNGTIVAPSKPEKKLRTVKKYLMLDSGDRDTTKYRYNNDIVFYLPRVYENVTSIRVMGAEFPENPKFIEVTGVTGSISATPLYYLIDVEGLNKSDECAVGASRSGFPDGYFAKIPLLGGTGYTTFYNDHSAQENIAHYYPPIGKLDRMHVRIRMHSQKPTGGSVFWNPGEYSLSLELECLENSFDSFSSFETRISKRSGSP
jgi:hypothetical protein